MVFASYLRQNGGIFFRFSLIILPRIQGKQVKLGIVVPESMAVYREEVYLRVKEENTQALLADENDLLAAAALWKVSK